MESYPPTPVTRYGITLLKEGIEPNITYISPNGDVAFYLNGGLAPWPGVTEGVVLAEGIEGLHPMFQHLDHKGARQDGATWADTVYDPAEMVMKVICTARTPEGLRKVIRQWVASWDPEKQGTLSWVTPDGGEWWCHPRLFRAPPEKMEATYARSKQQTFTWSIRNDDAFWRSHDSISTYGFAYNDAFDDFNRDDNGNLGPNWAQTYSGPGSGICETEDAFFGDDDFGRARWIEAGNLERSVVNRWLGHNAIQTVTITGAPTTWNLTFEDQTTGAITHPATAGTVQAALEALSNIAPGDVSVSGSAGGPYEVTFTGAYGKRIVADMDGSILSGGTNPAIMVATTTKGSAPVSGTDNQVIKIRMADLFEYPWGDAAYVDIWGRMDATGTTGIRVRIGRFIVRLSYFIGGVETVLREKLLFFGSIWGEGWTVILGTPTNPRHFRVLRGGGKNGGGSPVLDYKEESEGSALGAAYRGAGFGMQAGAAALSQTQPASVNDWSMGDNVTVTQSGHLKLTNVGDQDAYPDIVVYGPGMFKFGDGPGAEPTIEFGPLADGQVALIRTRPGQRSVYAITTDETPFAVESQEGTLYSLLKGRFSKPIPPRPIAGPPVTAEIAFEIKDGNAFSKVIAALTPMRRWPE